MSSIDSQWRTDNIKALTAAGIPLLEAVRIVEGVIANNGQPVIKPQIDSDDVISAIGDWMTYSPSLEADILNAD